MSQFVWGEVGEEGQESEVWGGLPLAGEGRSLAERWTGGELEKKVTKLSVGERRGVFVGCLLHDDPQDEGIGR